MRPGARRGATLVEMLVGFGLMALLSFGAWQLYVGLNKRATRLTDYGEVLRAVALLRARISQDIRNVEVPESGTGAPAFSLSPDGKTLSYVATLPQEQPAQATTPPPSQLLEWRLIDNPDGTVGFQREGDVEGLEDFPQLAAASARFRVEADMAGRQVAVIEASFALPARNDMPARAVPLKITHTARPPGTIAKDPAGWGNFPPYPPLPPAFTPTAHRTTIPLVVTPP